MEQSKPISIEKPSWAFPATPTSSPVKASEWPAKSFSFMMNETIATSNPVISGGNQDFCCVCRLFIGRAETLFSCMDCPRQLLLCKTCEGSLEQRQKHFNDSHVFAKLR